MSAVQSSSLRALRQLSAHSRQVCHVRQLHITGPATFPSPVIATERSILPGMAKDLSSLRAACSERGLAIAGTKDELMARLMAPATRNMTTQHGPKRATPGVTSAAAAQPVREINISRSLKQVNDSSTIDFAYLPQDPFPVPSDNASIRVPLIPDNYYPARTGVHAPDAAVFTEAVPNVVVTAAADSTHFSTPSTMSDVHDNTSVAVDFAGMVEGASRKAGQVGQGAEGAMRQLWSGVMDDVFGPKRSPGPA